MTRRRNSLTPRRDMNCGRSGHIGAVELSSPLLETSQHTHTFTGFLTLLVRHLFKIGPSRLMMRYPCKLTGRRSVCCSRDSLSQYTDVRIMQCTGHCHTITEWVYYCTTASAALALPSTSLASRYNPESIEEQCVSLLRSNCV